MRRTPRRAARRMREQADEMEGPVGNEARVDHGCERFDGFQRPGGDDLVDTCEVLKDDAACAEIHVSYL